jgi:hypothetical protein
MTMAAVGAEPRSQCEKQSEFNIQHHGLKHITHQQHSTSTLKQAYILKNE